MRLATCIHDLYKFNAEHCIGASASHLYKKIKTISVAGDGGWDYLTFDSNAHRLFIARSSRVQVVDVDTGILLGVIPNTRGVHGVALAPAINRGYASNGQDNSVTVFDLAGLKEIDRIKVGTRPDAIVFDSASNRIFTMNGGSRDASAMTLQRQSRRQVALGGKPEFAAADGKGMIFVNIEDKSEIAAFDSKTLELEIDGRLRRERAFGPCNGHRSIGGCFPYAPTGKWS